MALMLLLPSLKSEVQMFNSKTGHVKVTKLAGFVAAMALFSCSKKQADKAINKVTGAVARAANDCSEYNTEKTEDAEYVVRQTGADYNLHLYFLARDNKISVWNDKGLADSYYNIETKDPINYVGLERNPNDLDHPKETRKNCSESKAAALVCITRLEGLKKVLKEAKESLEAEKKFEGGRKQTIECTDKKVDELVGSLQKVVNPTPTPTATATPTATPTATATPSATASPTSTATPGIR